MRISTKGAVAALAAASLLVVGVDYATFAATGDSLVLGQLNTTTSATAISRTDSGPALRLRTRSDNAAPLSVNGTGRVAHLNADEVDGFDASQLETHAITYRAGRAGQVIPGQVLWNTPVRPGLYEVSFRALAWELTIPPGADTAQIICGVLDQNTVGQSPTVYTAQSATYAGNIPAAMSGAATVRISDTARPGFTCFPPSGEFALFKAIYVSFTKINSRESRIAREVPIPMGAKKSLLGR